VGRRLYLLGLLGRVSQPTGEDGGGGNCVQAEAPPLGIPPALGCHDGAEGRQEPEQPRVTPFGPQDSALYRLSLWWTAVLPRRTQVREPRAHTRTPTIPPTSISRPPDSSTISETMFLLPSNLANPNAAWAIRS
jgi:hypothetical protein